MKAQCEQCKLLKQRHQENIEKQTKIDAKVLKVMVAHDVDRYMQVQLLADLVRSERERIMSDILVHLSDVRSSSQ
jgi:hypothetical protein